MIILHYIMFYKILGLNGKQGRDGLPGLSGEKGKRLWNIFFLDYKT